MRHLPFVGSSFSSSISNFGIFLSFLPLPVLVNDLEARRPQALARADRRLAAESRRPAVPGIPGTLGGEPLDGRGPFLGFLSLSF